MKINLEVRDIKVFALGILAAFTFITIYDWEENVISFKEGYENGKKAYEKDQRD